MKETIHELKPALEFKFFRAFHVEGVNYACDFYAISSTDDINWFLIEVQQQHSFTKTELTLQGNDTGRWSFFGNTYGFGTAMEQQLASCIRIYTEQLF